MAVKTIETRAVISAEDKTGPAFAAVVQHMARMEDAARRAKIQMADMAADKWLAGGDRVTKLKDEHVAQRRVLAENRIGRREELAHLREVDRLEQRLHARRMAMGIAGGYVAHSTAHFAHKSLETYREFDKERRYGKAVMGITDDQQEPLLRQAIHGGATSKYNDIQWLEAQRELAARGLNPEQVRALAEVSATIGQAMDRTLPEASKALEGGMFGFGKDTSTYEKAVENAKRTADLQVKASKISGMQYDDLTQLYKYSATPFRLAGLSEEQMLAFGGVGKKANMGGAEMGTAGRALVSNLLKPTAGARTAMMANGIDFSTYQRQGTRPMDVEAFSKSIAASYGVELGEKAKGALQKVFNDKGVVADAGKFMPRVMEILSKTLGGDDAKAKKSIAGEARRYRDASMSGVDAPRLFKDLMAAMAGNPALANAIFGSKQGARIMAALGDRETFLHKLDELENHSQGFAKSISDERMAGFDGAVSRFEGAVKNLETAVGRAFDAGGKGGLLTQGADLMGRFTQALAEAPPGLQRLGVEAGAVGAIFAGMKGAEALLGGFGLKGSAVALTEAAHLLMGAAGEKGALGVAGGSALTKALPWFAGAGPAGLGAAALTMFVVENSDPALRLGGSKARDDYNPGDELPGLNEGRERQERRARGSLLGSSFNPIGAGGAGLPTFAQGGPSAKQQIDVKFGAPPTVVVQVEPTSALIAIVNKAQTVALKVGADTGPGGLGETGTGQH